MVPYHRRRGEDRRPLYLECTTPGVIFHPEHKAMPIAALLSGYQDPSSVCPAEEEVERRVAQQRQKLVALPANVDKTPYLLLLLRPGGVNTYTLLQRAIKGLPLDFGYEFIDDDWVKPTSPPTTSCPASSRGWSPRNQRRTPLLFPSLPCQLHDPPSVRWE